jgi:probable rRNA maturation factor
MSSCVVDIACQDDAWACLDFNIEDLLNALTLRVREHITPWCDQDWEVSVLLTSDAGIRPLNAQHRGQDKATNVLSFGVFEEPVSKALWQDYAHPGMPFLLGDIVLSYDTLAREAQEQEKTFQNHLSHLMVHGLVHLLGYDHIGEEEAQQMESLESDILAGAGVPNPYILGT